MGPSTRDQGAHRPQRHRDQSEARSTPLGDLADDLLAHRLPATHHPLRTQSQPLPRVPHPRRSHRVFQKTPPNHHMRHGLRFVGWQAIAIRLRATLLGLLGAAKAPRPAERTAAASPASPAGASSPPNDWDGTATSSNAPRFRRLARRYDAKQPLPGNHPTGFAAICCRRATKLNLLTHHHLQ
jgi:hypothetical protein